MNASDLETAARGLVEAAAGGRIALEAFERRLPRIAEQIGRDADSPLLDLWGRSGNIDNDSGAQIVHPKLLTAIGALARLKIRVADNYHAGLLHTYGYLLSWIETPHGYKRERWLRGTLENGLHLPARSLRAVPGSGTLLQNLSFFLGQVVFRGVPAVRDRLRVRRSDVSIAPGLRRYPYEQLEITRIVERVLVPGGGLKVSGDRWVALITDLVSFVSPGRRPKDPSALLVYAVDDAHAGGTRLITCFPVPEAVRQALCRPDGFGRARPVRPRYNACVEGFPAGGLRGVRTLLR